MIGTDRTSFRVLCVCGMLVNCAAGTAALGVFPGRAQAQETEQAGSGDGVLSADEADLLSEDPSPTAESAPDLVLTTQEEVATEPTTGLDEVKAEAPDSATGERSTEPGISIGVAPANSLEDELEGDSGSTAAPLTATNEVPADQTTAPREVSATGEEGSSLLDQLESDAPVSNPAAAAMRTDKVSGQSDAELFAEGVSEDVFRQQRLMDADVSRLQFSLADLQNGILIRRLPKGVAGSPGLDGYTGIYRTLTAERKDRYSFRFGAHTSFYYNSALWDDASQAHLDAIGFFVFSVLPELEVKAAANASGHHAGISGRFANEPLYQILGDVTFGAKYSYQILPWLSAAGVWDLKFYTNLGRFGIRWDAFSTLFMAVGSIDWRQFPYYRFPFPWRTHVNLGYYVDQSKNISSEINGLSASSYYGLGLSPGDKLMMRFAVDYPDDPLDYFIEYSTEQIVNRRDTGVRVNKWTQSPSRFTLGVRYNPIENIIIDGAFDMSWGLQQSLQVFGKLQPPNNPYALNFGVTYEWNPRGWAVFDLRGIIRGIVVDADTGEPVGGAIVEYVENERETAQAADGETGEFQSYRLPPGRVTIQVRKENYEPTLIEPEVFARKTMEEKIFLRRAREATDTEVGVLVGQVLDSQNKPLAAVLEFADRTVGDIPSSPDDGSFIRILSPGTYAIRVTAPGYEAKSYEVPVESRKKTRVLFQLISGEEVGAIAGTVLDDQGQPLSARVLFLDARIEPLVADATGNFLRVLPAGSYKLQIELSGYSTRMIEVPVESGRKTTLDIKLEPEQAEGAMAGRVLSNLERPLAAVLTFDDPRIAPVPTDPETGSYLKIMTPGNYDITVQAPGYETKRFRIPVLKNKKTVQDFVLRGIQELGQRLARLEGDRIVLTEPIAFEPGSTLLTERAYLVLNDVAKILLQIPDSRITIISHTNNLGPSKANLVLSEGRAIAAKEYLTSIGMLESQLDAKGFGEEQPLVSNDTAEGRTKNERVEILVKQKN